MGGNGDKILFCKLETKRKTYFAKSVERKLPTFKMQDKGSSAQRACPCALICLKVLQTVIPKVCAR